MGRVRSISDDEKREKREHIKSCALSLFEETGALPSADKIAKSSGMAKGTLYLYFKTKEEVFLEILMDHYQKFFLEVGVGLQEKRPESLEALASLIIEAFEGKEQFLELAGMAPTILERNVRFEKIIEFKMHLIQGLGAMAEYFCQMMPAMQPEKAAKVLVQTFALIMGMHQQSAVSGDLVTIKADPKFAGLFMDFHQEVHGAIVAFWKGHLS